MRAEDCVRAANLAGALRDLEERVRRSPGDASLRVFLFQLLAVLGQWERSLTQLGVAAELDPANTTMAQTYREAIRAEPLRSQVFAGKRTPVVFGDPAEWVAWLIEALHLAGAGRHEEARALRERALEQAPATAGTVNGSAFEWIADADPRMGPVLEVVMNGRYCWIPFDRIQKVAMEAPADLRDFVWMPAFITLSTGGEAAALVPARYPGSELHADDKVRLGRLTDWAEKDGVAIGVGQRLLATDAAEYAVMDVREIGLRVPPVAS
ncbi:MAG TPA: type VI secretion system accessory protein TagJ [Polyangiaceae bacterium]